MKADVFRFFDGNLQLIFKITEDCEIEFSDKYDREKAKAYYKRCIDRTIPALQRAGYDVENMTIFQWGPNIIVKEEPAS